MQTAQLLEQLYSGKTLNKEESAVIFNAIMQGELNNEQIAAMLIALKVRGATIEELSGAVSASLQNAKSFPRPDYPLRILWVLAVMVKTQLIFLLRVPLLQPLWVPKWQNTATVAYQANQVPVMY